MPICSTGISALKSGMPHSVVVDAAYVQSLLPPALAWLYPYLPFMHGLQIGDADAFCSIDPPNWTLPSSADIYQFLTGGSLAQVQAVNQFLVNITGYYLWFGLCECTSVTTPAPGSPPAAPSGLPAVNPTGLVVPPGAPCSTFSGRGSIADTNTSLNLLTGQLCDGSGQPTCASLATAIPTNTTFVDFTATLTALTGAASPGFGWDPYIQGYNASNVTIVNLGATTVVQGTNSQTGYVATGHYSRASLGSSTKLTLLVNAQPAPGVTHNLATMNGQIDFQCGTTPPLVAPPCCTGIDPLTTSTLNLILQRLDLMQRQIVPFAYITGATHSGLSGTGTVSVQGVLGVLLNVSIPSRAGESVGTPDTRFDVGWINFGTTDGYEERRFIQSDSQLVFPNVGGIWTIVGYSLLPGVTMTLTEIIREP